uniref:Uncharacterized protein n=1 Tax=Globodera rostochiensis TaxID=31243 RepID=A0A914HA57_GLORO
MQFIVALLVVLALFGLTAPTSSSSNMTPSTNSETPPAPTIKNKQGTVKSQPDNEKEDMDGTPSDQCLADSCDGELCNEGKKELVEPPPPPTRCLLLYFLRWTPKPVPVQRRNPLPPPVLLLIGFLLIYLQ